MRKHSFPLQSQREIGLVCRNTHIIQLWHLRVPQRLSTQRFEPSGTFKTSRREEKVFKMTENHFIDISMAAEVLFEVHRQALNHQAALPWIFAKFGSLDCHKLTPFYWDGSTITTNTIRINPSPLSMETNLFHALPLWISPCFETWGNKINVDCLITMCQWLLFTYRMIATFS